MLLNLRQTRQSPRSAHPTVVFLGLEPYPAYIRAFCCIYATEMEGKRSALRAGIYKEASRRWSLLNRAVPN